MIAKPLAIDLFTGLHGWSDGLIAEGFRVVGFDIVDMSAEIGHPKPDHFSLVIQDVLTLRGSQFKDAALIVASPPCQFFSYCAMPWTRAKALATAVRADPARLEKELALFRACFRIQREACEAAGRHIPMVVENVRGAIPWVGRSRWNFGSFHLWGDVPALMPHVSSRATLKPQQYQRRHGTGSWFAIDMASARRGVTNASDVGQKVPGFRFDGSGRSFQSASVAGIKGVPHRTTGHWTNPAEHEEGTKHPVSGHAWYRTGHGRFGSKSDSRKAASAMIAKIPLPLSRHIAATFRPMARAA